jgi:hypothetical protein
MKFGENINYLWKMKELILITLLFCCAFTTKAQNLILNGSFEQNSVNPIGNCAFNIPNTSYTNLMDSSSSFSVYGSIENGIFFENCTTFSNSTANSVAQDGNYSVFLGGQDTIMSSFHYQQYTAYSLILTQQLQVGNYYRLIFYHKILPLSYGYFFKKGKLVIGHSNSDTIFGEVIDTINYPLNEWTKVDIIFQSIIPAQHITIKSILEEGIKGSLVDNFVLTLDSMPPNAINEEPQQKKQLLKIVDILGRESKSKKGLLFYIYSDGTVEKKLIIE